MRRFLLLTALPLAAAMTACGEDDSLYAEDPAPSAAMEAEAPPEPAPEPAPEPEPVDEASLAREVAETYWSLIEDTRYAEAYDLWRDGGAASGMTERAFAGQFEKYAEIRADVGAPGRVEGAAGSLYVEFPVRVSGILLDDGSEVTMEGAMTLRRANNVPGATMEELSWRVADSDLAL